jgi:hypothetical protein
LHEVICGEAGKYLAAARLPLPDRVVFRIALPAGQPALAELRIKLRPILSRSPGLWELAHPASRRRFLQQERRSPNPAVQNDNIIATTHSIDFGILFSSTNSKLNCLPNGTLSFCSALASARWVPANTNK